LTEKLQAQLALDPMRSGDRSEGDLALAAVTGRQA